MDKELKEIGLNIPEKEYRDLDHLSSSFFSSLSRMGSTVLLDSFDGNDGTMFGSIVDDYICGTHNPDEYYTMPEEFNIGEKLKKAIDMIFKAIDHNLIEDSNEYYNQFVLMLTQMPNIPYYDSKDPEWRATKILTEGGDYFKLLLESRGKKIITYDLYNNAIDAAKLLLTHEFTGHIFKLKEGQEGVFQFQFVFNYLDEDMKGMLDWLVVDHNNKTIRPYDIKTGSSKTDQFESTFYHWRYDIQALLYTIICKFLVRRWYNGYKILPFTFIYASRTEKGKVLKYEIDKTHLLGARNGYVRNGKEYRGVAQLIKDLEWYKANNFEVDHPKEIYDNNGVIKLEPLEL